VTGKPLALTRSVFIKVERWTSMPARAETPALTGTVT
jgi:hypothetical protein